MRPIHLVFPCLFFRILPFINASLDALLMAGLAASGALAVIRQRVFYRQSLQSRQRSSFHSVDADAEMGGTDDSCLRWNGTLGVGLPIVDPLAPVLDSNESQHKSFGTLRGAPYLGAEDDLGGATSVYVLHL